MAAQRARVSPDPGGHYPEQQHGHHAPAVGMPPRLIRDIERRVEPALEQEICFRWEPRRKGGLVGPSAFD